MSLRYEIPLILLAVVVVYSFFNFAILQGLVYPSYLSLERREAEKDLARCVESLRGEIHHLDTVTHDWAAWDDMHAFVRNPSQRFADSNLGPETFFDNRIDLICIYDGNGAAVWGQAWDSASKKMIELPEFHPFPAKAVGVFLRPESPHDSVSGVYRTSRGPMIVAGHPITTSDHKGPVSGHLVMGKFIGEKMIAALNVRTRVEHRIMPLPLAASHQQFTDELARISKAQPVVLTAPEGGRLQAFAIFPDINGKPALFIRAFLPVDIRRKGLGTLRFAFYSTTVSGLVIIGVLLLLMHRIVIAPLTRLTRRVTTFKGGRCPPATPIPGDRNEIGVLFRAFGEMTTRIERGLRRQEGIFEKLRSEISERRRVEADLITHQARLREMSRDLLLTEERERRRIAVDLHDRIGQNLALVQIRLDELVRSHGESCLTGRLSELSRFTEEIIRDTRSLTIDISPPVIYGMGLVAALEWLADDHFERFGIPVAISGSREAVPLEQGLSVSLCRTVRELLHNAAKHSGAPCVGVDIRRKVTSLQITVSDGGRGFDPSRTGSGKPPGGLGLFSIRERLGAVGGTVEIDSQPGAGTRVTLLLPLAVEEIEKGKHHGY